MYFNVIVGLIIPWILAMPLIFRHQKILVLIAPIAAVLAFSIDVLGFQFDYWHIKPIHDNQTFSALPFHLGLYAILTCYMVVLIAKQKVNPYLLIVVFALITTILELIAVILGRVVYSNGWSIILTYFSYLLPYFLAYMYYLLLKRLAIL